MSITNSREFTINVGKIAEAEKWLSEGADLWKEITGKDDSYIQRRLGRSVQDVICNNL